MKKILVSVSDDLKDFCPLTTWQRLGIYWGQIKPFLFTAIAVTALVFGIFSFTHSFYRVASVSGLIAVFAIVWCVIAFADKKPLAYVREQIRQRNKDGYWMAHTIRKDGSGDIYGTISTSSIVEWEAERRFISGFHVLLPFDGKRHGRIFFGENASETRPNSDRINAQLERWSLEPVFLTKGRFHTLPIRVVDPVGKSMELPLFEAIEFLARAPIGWLDDNTLAGAFASHRMNRDRLRREREKLETNLSEALAALIGAASVLDSNGLTFLSPCEMIIARGPIVEPLDRLLPSDDPRRAKVNFPPKPLPDIAPAANKPPASGDDGHCCCSGP